MGAVTHFSLALSCTVRTVQGRASSGSVRITANTAAASVDETTAPSSTAVRASTSSSTQASVEGDRDADRDTDGGQNSGKPDHRPDHRLPRGQSALGEDHGQGHGAQGLGEGGVVERKPEPCLADEQPDRQVRAAGWAGPLRRTHGPPRRRAATQP